jgi:hypothetical protein
LGKNRARGFHVHSCSGSHKGKGFNVEAVAPKCVPSLIEMLAEYDPKKKKKLCALRREMLNADT